MIVKRPMVTFLTQLRLAIRSRFTRRARLEAENLILLQQLVVLRRKSPTRVRRPGPSDSGQMRVFRAAKERIPKTEDSLAERDGFELEVPLVEPEKQLISSTFVSRPG